MNRKNKKKGFTFWELLIVIGIISVLAANAVPGHGYRDPYRGCLKNISKISVAVESFYFDTGTKITVLDDSTFKKMYEKEYFKKKLYLPVEDKCKYLINNDGTVYCEYHGSIEYSYGKGLGIPPSPEFLNELKKKKIMDIHKKYVPFIILGVGVLGLLISTLTTKFKK